jgi:malonyl-CoA O-methyltransferase
LGSIFPSKKKTTPLLSPLEAYNLWAPTYDRKNSNPLILIEEKILPPYFESLQLQHKTLVDFGCGTGRYLKQLRDQGTRQVVGVDFSRLMLEQVKTNSVENDLFLVNSSVDCLPFNDSIFDIGVSTLVMSYVADLDSTIGEMARVVRSGGSMLIADLHPIQKQMGWKRNFTVTEPAGSQITYEITHHHHTIAAYLQSFEKNQLTVELTAEPVIDASMKNIFERFEMSRAYHKYAGTPILLIFKLRKR